MTDEQVRTRSSLLGISFTKSIHLADTEIFFAYMIKNFGHIGFFGLYIGCKLTVVFADSVDDYLVFTCVGPVTVINTTVNRYNR